MPSVLHHPPTMFPDFESSSPLSPFTDAGVSSPEEGASDVVYTYPGEMHYYNSFGRHRQPSRRASFCTDYHGSKEAYDCSTSPRCSSDQQFLQQTRPYGSPRFYDMQNLSSPGVSSPLEYSSLESFYQGQHASSSSSPFPAFSPATCEELSSPLRPLLWHTGCQDTFNLQARLYSSRFPGGHMLNACFVQVYELGAELGFGGYGFVMTARHRADGNEVAVKFIIKSEVPDDAWMEHEEIGRFPSEIMLLSLLDHENIVKCLDVFEDDLYFYLVQELHGTPWHKSVNIPLQQFNAAGGTPRSASLPYLSPCVSEHSSIDSGPYTPPQHCTQLDGVYNNPMVQIHTGSEPYTIPDRGLFESERHCHPVSVPPCPRKASRPSYDLFECIEQSPHKRLTEDQARYIFAQVVEAVYYLDNHGITHRDIKDENLVIDKDLRVKLIDFGSAVMVDPERERPYYHQFYGTIAYASSEILRKELYQAAPAEIWTLGVLLSFLLTGTTPFLSERDAIEGNIVLNGATGASLSRDVVCLMRRCLDPDPRNRADINEVRGHRWLVGALDRS